MVQIHAQANCPAPPDGFPLSCMKSIRIFRNLYYGSLLLRLRMRGTEIHQKGSSWMFSCCGPSMSSQLWKSSSGRVFRSSMIQRFGRLSGHTLRDQYGRSERRQRRHSAIFLLAQILGRKWSDACKVRGLHKTLFMDGISICGS